MKEFTVTLGKMESELKEARQEIARLKRKVAVGDLARLALNAKDDWVAVVDRDHKYVHVNKAYLEIYEVQLEDVLGRTVSDFLGDEFYESFVRGNLEQCFNGEKVQYVSEKEYPSKGKLIVRVRYYPVWINGQVEYVAAYIQDVTDDARREHDLTVNSRRFQALYDASPSFLMVKDTAGHYMSVNRAFAEALGRTPESIMGRTDYDLFDEQLAARCEIYDKTVLETSESCTSESNLVMDGINKTFLTIRSPIFDRDKKIEGICVICTDITERMRAEQELIDSEERFRSLFQNNHAVMLLVDSEDGQIVDVNPAASKYYGWSREQMVQMKISEINTSPLNRIRACVNQALEGKCNQFDFRHRLASGAIRHVEVYSGLIPVKGRNLLYSLVFDVTERKRAETVLRFSEFRFKSILENVQFVGVSLDTNGNVVYANPFILNLTGWERDEIIGRSWFDYFIPEEMRETIREVFQDVLASGDDSNFTYYENDILRKDGKKRLVGWSNILDRNPVGDIVGLTGIGVDVTERVAAEEAILKAKEAAEAANKAKSEFLANMSHEIRTPLNGVLGMLHIIAETELDEDQTKLIGYAIKSSQRLTSLLSDILDLSKVEADSLEIVEAEFEVADLKRSIMELFPVSTRIKGVELGFGIASGVPDRLVGDESRFRQILFNLVGNALKFTENGHVQVEVSRLPEYPGRGVNILTVIRDTGIGIPDERLRDIFNPFSQVEGAYVRKHQGAGLGLSIVKKLVKLMGGELAIDNALGNGTEIYLSLPFGLPEGHEKCVTVTGFSGGEEKKSLRILVAEDDELNALVTKRMLQKLGHELIVATTGFEVIEELTANEVDLIFMDVQMPIMDGVAATRAIRSGEAGDDKAGVPIVAVTAYAMVGDREKFLAEGMNDYLAKPVDVDSYGAVIERLYSGKL